MTKYTYGRYSQYKFIHLPLPRREKNLTSTCQNCHISRSALYCFPFNSKLANFNLKKVLHKFSSNLQHHHLPTCIKGPDFICAVLCMKRADCVLRAVIEDYYIDDNHNHYLNVMHYTDVLIQYPQLLQQF